MQTWKSRVVSPNAAVVGEQTGYKGANALLWGLLRIMRMAGRGASTLPLGEPVRDAGAKDPVRCLEREARRG